MAGVRIVSFTPYKQVGYILKCKPNGDTIWVKNVADNEHHFSFQYRNVFELADHSLLLFGQLDIPVPYNTRLDLIVTHLAADGNFIWQKSFVTPLYPGDSTEKWFLINDAKSAADGSIYVCGGVVHYGISREPFTAKFSPDGSLIWSKGIGVGDGQFNGINIVGSQVQAYGSDGSNSLFAVGFNLNNGDTVFSKKWIVSPSYPDAFYRYVIPSGIVQLNNGNTVFYGRCYGDFFAYPFPGSIPHMGTLELSPSFDVVRSTIITTSQNTNYYSSKIVASSDASLSYSFVFGSVSAPNMVFGKMKNNQLLQERYIPLASQPNSMSNMIGLPDGGDAVAENVMANAQGTLSGIKLMVLHSSDTSGGCFGVDTSMTAVVYNFINSISDPVVAELSHSSLLPENDGPNIISECKQVSFCDSLKLFSSSSTICVGSEITIHTFKNKECGTKIIWSYDSNYVQNFTHINDTTVRASFSDVYEGYISGHIYGCADLSDSVKVFVLQAPSSLNLGRDTTLCPGNTVVLNAHKGYASYQWQNGSVDSVFIATQPGTYFVETVDACGNIFRDTVTITSHASASIDLGPDRTKCNDDTLHLNAQDGFLNYSWSNNYNINSISSQNVIVNPVTDTAYYVKAEKTPGCFAYDTIRVHVNTSPLINLGADKSFCNGDSTVFDAGSGFVQYTWSTGSNLQQIQVKTAGTFSVIASNIDGCKSYDTVKVLNVFANPTVSLDHNPSLCMGTSRILDAGNFPSYLWNNGSASEKIIINGIGTYAVQVTDNNGCKGGDTTIITTLLSSPSDFLPDDTLLCSYENLSISPRRPYSTYLWNTGVSVSSITVSQPGLYWLQVKDANGCIGKDTINIDPKDCIRGFYIPTAFTPNNDYKNDLFKPLLFGNVKKYQFIIYNRWGQIVFQTTELNKAWDGTVSGEPQDPNVFVWVCTYQFVSEEVKTERGTVVLIR
jgi:gliding motility-associated-like protein